MSFAFDHVLRYYLYLMEIDLRIRNKLFFPLFTIINDFSGDLNFLYGLVLLMPSSGIGTRNCDIWRKLAS